MNIECRSVESLSHRGVGLYALWAGGRGVGAATPKSPLPARRLHRLKGRRGGFAPSFYKIDRIHSFDVGRSMFDVHKSLLRSDRPLLKPAVALTPET
jgi:hypothetical protein